MTDTIKIIDAAGAPADLGRQIGAAVRDSFNDAVTLNHEFRQTRAQFEGSDYLKALRDAATAAYPHHMAELEGMAEGIGTDAETLALASEAPGASEREDASGSEAKGITEAARRRGRRRARRCRPRSRSPAA